MKVIVTGPDGVLGSNLVRELIARDHKVSVLLLKGTTSKTLDGLNIDKFYGDILEKDSLNAAFTWPRYCNSLCGLYERIPCKRSFYQQGQC